MTLFWIATAVVAAVAGWLVLEGARRGAAVSAAPMADAELAELDRLKARGLIDPAAHSAARAEAARRLLAQAETRPLVAVAGHRLWVLCGLGATVAAALGLYVAIGEPGAPDQPYEQRVSEWAGRLETLEAPELAAVVERVVRERPDDRHALNMLGAARFEAGDPIGAAQAFRRALDIDANDPQSWARLGESLVRANQGAVGADAEAAFLEAIRRDPNQLGSRFFLGEAALARGDHARTREMWTPLIAALSPSDPRRAELERRLPPAGDGRGASA